MRTFYGSLPTHAHKAWMRVSQRRNSSTMRQYPSSANTTPSAISFHGSFTILCEIPQR